MIFIREAARIIWLEKSAVIKLLQLFLHCSHSVLSKDFESLFDNVLGKDGLILNDVVWWIGPNISGNGIGDVDIGLGKIMEGMGTKN